MKITLPCFLAFLFVLPTFSNAQGIQDTIVQDKTPCYFFNTKKLVSDSIPEGQNYKFIFVLHNCSDHTLLIKNVRSSCGCLTPKWSKEPIQAGDSILIIGTYSSRGRPGPFTKTMTVDFVNGEKEMLVMKGYVKPKPPSKIIWDKTEHDFGNVQEGPPLNTTYTFTNTSDDTIRITKCYASFGPCDYSLKPIPPRGQGEVKYRYNTKYRIGWFKKSIVVYFSNSESRVLSARGEVIAEKDHENVLGKDSSDCYHFDYTSLSCDTIEEGTKYEFKFKLHNCSKTPLVIRGVRSSCGCLSPNWSKEPIQPGAYGTVTGLYNSKGRIGYFHKTLTVELNNGQTKYLTMVGIVIPKKRKEEKKAILISN